MGHEHLRHYAFDKRPWGTFEQFVLNEPVTLKILEVMPRQRFSLQKHQHRDEFWRILSGNGTVEVGDTATEARAGDEFFIPRTATHRAQGGDEALRILEISFGVFDEHDEVRLEDDYGRR